MKVFTIVGARPQFIKAGPVSRCLRVNHTEYLLHTGQHYDDALSRVFFRDLELPEPDLNLNVGSGSHGKQTAAMLAGIEQALLREMPDLAMVYGDTNSTLAGALAAAKLQIPVAHVEAGLRSFNRQMPEEINRVVTDHLSSLLFCPSQTAVDHLKREGIISGVHSVGDVMADAHLAAAERYQPQPPALDGLDLKAGQYLLVTLHRAENTDDSERLRGVLAALEQSSETVIFPLHPRTRRAIEKNGYRLRNPRVHLIEPVGYLEMVQLERSARCILTDSGGIQKEAYWLGIPCITLRNETEWVETVAAGWNVLAGTDTTRIVDLLHNFQPQTTRQPLYGDGRAAQRIVAILDTWLG